MENKKLVGIYRLFVILFVFVASIFILNTQKSKNLIATHFDISHSTVSGVDIISLEKAYEYIDTLLLSHNIDLTVKVINQSMQNFSVDLIEKIIIDNKYALSNIQKIEILFGIIGHNAIKKHSQYKILDFLLEYPSLYGDNAALLMLMRSNYRTSLPVFLNWVRDRQKDNKWGPKVSQFIDDALFMAINQNDYVIVESMFSKKIRISPEKASQLLLFVVKEGKNSKFVSLLVRCAQADINYVENEKTLLIEAVERNNKDMIYALLEEGAVVDRVVDPQKGTALQVAMMHTNDEIQQLLKEYGA